MSEWQPIDTAPKDKFILVSNGYEVAEAMWNEYDERWDGQCLSANPPPTHWVPLPDPPAPLSDAASSDETAV